MKNYFIGQGTSVIKEFFSTYKQRSKKENISMKKKIIATLFTAIIATSAFLMGHATTATEKTMIAVEDVTDWNTNGEELSLSLSDNTEVYAYKSSNVYGEKRAYIHCKDVASWKVTDEELTIITEDGNEYVFEK